MRWAWTCAALLAGCSVEIPTLPVPEGSGLVILVHGGGDDPSVWAEGLGSQIESIQQERGTDGDWDIVALDWSGDAADVLTAARRGRQVGNGLVEALGAWQDVHVVAHSVGAHVAHGIAEGGVASLHLTLLDPFVGSGLVRWSYGRTRFGVGADFAEAYVNRDDGVPSSDGLLDEAHVFDVTDARPRELTTSEEGHRWPITMYGASEGQSYGIELARWARTDLAWDAYPPGEVTELASVAR